MNPAQPRAERPAQPDKAPDREHRPGLSQERTVLAWRRTALSLGAGLLAGLRLAVRSGNPWTNPLTWVVLAVAALYLGLMWRYALRRNTEQRGVGVVGATALLTSLGGLGALVFVLSRL